MKSKRFFSLFLSLCLLVSAVPVFAAAAENPFTDVPENKYYFQPVLWAVENGITTGKTATTFAPNDPCTRKQIVTFLWRAAGEPAPDSMVNPFVDVKADRFEQAILWAYYKGITTGTTETTFSGDNTCTRKQIVTFLWRYMGQPQAQNTANPFVDVKADRFQNAILWAYYSGITTGTGDGSTFSPEDPCTRGQIVTFLYRADGESTPPPQDTPTQPTGPALDAETIYAKCAPAVFTIESYYENGDVYNSSYGFFIDSSGIAVVSIGVLKDDLSAAHSAVIRTSDTGAEYPVSGVYDYSEEEGWAVIQVEGSGFPYLPIGDADAVTKGAQVFAVSWYFYPGEDKAGFNGYEFCIKNTSVEKYGKNYFDIYKKESASGFFAEYGALVNPYGQVIGILAHETDGGTFHDYALPISYIENYNRENLRSLEEIKPGYHAFINAYTGLTKWIEENHTAYEDGCYIYEETEEIEGAPCIFRLRWSAGDDDLTVTTTYIDGTATITATMNYTADMEDSISSYSYTDTQDNSHDATITAWIPREKYAEHYYHILPDSYDGNKEDWEVHISFNQTILFNSLEFTNRVFRYFSDYTVADLGFTAYQFLAPYDPEADNFTNAYNSLAQWIYENYTAYEYGYYIYEEWRVGEGEYADVYYPFWLYWNPSDYSIIAMVSRMEGSTTITAEINYDISAGPDRAETFYIYEDTQNDSLYTKISANIDCNLFDKDYVILFDSYEGDYSGIQPNRSNYSILLQTALDCTNTVFGQYSDYTVADLGFTAYQNNSGNPGEGAFADAYHGLAQWIQANYTAYEDGYYIYEETEEISYKVYQYQLRWAPGDDHITAVTTIIDPGIILTSTIEYTADMEPSICSYSCDANGNNSDSNATAYIDRGGFYEIRFESYEGDKTYLETDRKNLRIMIKRSLDFTDKVFGYFSDFTTADLGFIS